MPQSLEGSEPVGCKRIGDHRHNHIEMDFDQDGRGKRIEVEKLHRLCDPVFNPSAASIVSNE